MMRSNARAGVSPSLCVSSTAAGVGAGLAALAAGGAAGLGVGGLATAAGLTSATSCGASTVFLPPNPKLRLKPPRFLTGFSTSGSGSGSGSGFASTIVKPLAFISSAITAFFSFSAAT